MDLGLSERTALVTGSWRGTGRGTARVLAREGAHVLVHGFELESAEAVADSLRAEGGRASAVAGDIRSAAGADLAAEAALEAAAGRVDVLVNNYGVAEGPGWLDGDDADWLDIYHKNVLSGVRLVRRLVPGMKERGFGRVIFVSTVGTVRPAARMPHYYASKAALPTMAVSLAKELSHTGITVNTVSPGLVATEEVKQRFLRIGAERGWGTRWEEVEPHAARAFLDNPTGRVADPEDVGELIAFLASERAWYINGVDLRIDGGAADCAR
jgi:NAD(P)-dependent dehydrogenase (short-subunit alcohol dehydrogenase family)